MTLQKSELAVRQHLDLPTEFKFAGNAGQFEGYAAVFGNVDLGGDRILPGAFQEIVRTRDGKVLVLNQHDRREPIGKADVEEDNHGLHFRGELLLDDEIARKVYVRMKGGLVDGMSIGYNVLPGGASMDRNGVRELSKLALYEVSVVTWGMNPEARIDGVKLAKTAADCTTLRELEDLIRESLDLSSRKARKAASLVWPILTGVDSEEAEQAAVQAAAQTFQSVLDQASRAVSRATN